MPAGIKIQYDDEWISDNWQTFRNWLNMCDAYNEAHNTGISYNTFKSHCNRIGLNYHYTDEQKQWLRDNYPYLGRVKCTKKFNERFGENRTINAINVECVKLGITVTEERKKTIPIENTGRFHEIGTVRKMSHGEPYIKTEAGWKRLKDITYGDKPKGYIIAHLDNDVDNYAKDNLAAIPRAISAKMTVNKFWSESPDITKTGILCCELEEALETKGELWKKQQE